MITQSKPDRHRMRALIDEISERGTIKAPHASVGYRRCNVEKKGQTAPADGAAGVDQN